MIYVSEQVYFYSFYLSITLVQIKTRILKDQDELIRFPKYEVELLYANSRRCVEETRFA